MKTRVISGVIIGILLFLVLNSGGYVLAAVLCAVSFVAYYELVHALSGVDNERPIKHNWLSIPGFLGILLHYGLIVFTKGDPRFFATSILCVFFGVAVLYVVRFPRYHATQAVGAVFAFLYAPVMLSFLYHIRSFPYGAAIVWVPFDAWICDTFAYLTGRIFGRHKLCPKLSPKKTVEGAIGGAFFAMLTGLIFGFLLSRTKDFGTEMIGIFALIGLACGVTAQFGDLLASAFKRDHDIKDYGSLIPGHGGFMDRFDSVIFVTPVVYALVRVLVVR